MRRVSFGKGFAGWLLLFAAFMAATVSCITSPMPYRPGYGLGSWLPPDVVDGMKLEAHSRSAIYLANQLDNDATSLARELQIAERPVQNPLNDEQDIAPPLSEGDYQRYMEKINQLRKSAWDSKVKSYEKLLTQMEADIKTLQEAAEEKNPKGLGKVFSTFASDIESAVNWETSKIDMQNRAFDSITVSSNFLDTDTIRQFQGDYASNFTYATNSSNKTSARMKKAKKGKAAQFVFDKLQSQMNMAVSDRLQQTYSVQAVESTLVLSSFATHRLVKQFTTLRVDADKLRQAWNYWKKDDPIPHPYFQHDEFGAQFAEAVNADLKTNLDRISMVTEIFQGSAMVGFVHFIKVETTNASQTMTSADYMAAASTLKMTNFIDTKTGGTSFSHHAAAAIADMASSSGLDIQFDIVCLGYIPQIASTKLDTSVSQILKMDVADQTASSPGAVGQNEQQSNAKALIDGVIQSLNTVVRTNPVLGVQTFMDAFNDYAKAANEKPEGMGAPIGMNVKSFAKIDVLSALSESYFGIGTPTGTSAAADNFVKKTTE